jgi:hypothetical protein
MGFWALHQQMLFCNEVWSADPFKPFSAGSLLSVRLIPAENAQSVNEQTTM